MNVLVYIICQVGLPIGGAVDAIRKESFAVDLLCGIIAGLFVIIGVLWRLLQKKDKENADLKDNTIKELKEQNKELMRHGK